MSDFSSLLNNKTLLAAIREAGWTAPTPIQTAAIPKIASLKDVLAVAMTGSGKTGAYLMPIVDRLFNSDKPKPRRPLVLVLVPTRELAQQVSGVLSALVGDSQISHGLVYGGVGYARQRKLLTEGIQILIATPGRLIDLMDQGHCLLDRIAVLVLDEADRMLDMGFQPDIEKIASKLPHSRQSIFLSATFPPQTRRFAQTLLKNAEEVFVDAPSTTVREVEQVLLPVAPANKQSLLYELLANRLPQYSIDTALVFANSRVQAGRLKRYLERRELAVMSIHGGMSQSARDEVLRNLHSGAIRALIATDVLARGIDVDSLRFVINYDVPLTVESYVHRIGRTARAGKSGIGLTIATPEDVEEVSAIELHIDQFLRVDMNHPYSIELPRNRRASRRSASTNSLNTANNGGIEQKSRRTRTGKKLTVEYKPGQRRRSLSGKISAGRSKRVNDEKYLPEWKKRQKNQERRK
jgi:ATP-dependent RNA helicase RhlE